MSQPYYPKLDLGGLASLMTIRTQLGMFEDYLDRKECPYDADTVGQINRLLETRVVEKVVEKIVERKVEVAVKAAEGAERGPKLKIKSSGVDLEGVSKEIQDIRDELKNLKTDGAMLETSDRIQIIKTRAALIEKLVSMDDKINNLKRLSLFQSVVMGVMDDLMPEDRRKEFMKRIEPFAKEETG
jgi:hypothetical protein